MSGFEIVGLILGVFGLAGPVQSVAKSVISSAKSSASFQDFLEDTSSRIALYERRYFDICSTLLKLMGLDKSAVREMFGNGGAKHDKWKDKEFILELERYLGPDKEVIYIAMRSVQREISKLQRKLGKLAKTIFSPPTQSQNAAQNSMSGGSSRTKLSMKEKYKISSKLKGKIEKCLDKFSNKLDDFERVVDQLVDKRSKSLVYHERQCRKERDERLWKRVDDYQWGKILRQISLAQTSSKGLFKTLINSNGKCNCHELNLWLDFDLVKALKPLTDPEEGFIPVHSYHFFVLFMNQDISYNGGDGLVDCQPLGIYQTLEVRSGPTLSSSFIAPLARPSGSVVTFSPQLPLPVVSEQTNIPSKHFSFKDYYQLRRFYSKSKRPNMPQISPPRAPPKIPIVIPTESSDNEEPSAGPDEPASVISNLCSLFSDLGPLENQNEHASDCLGRLKDPSGFQHQLYAKGTQPINNRNNPSGMPLRDLIAQRDDFLPEDRLRVAYHLASSLLQLHVPTWIAEAWTSSDIKLVNHTSQAIAEDWLPFSQCFHKIEDDGNHSAAASTPKLLHISRLGILLLELGRTTPLSEDLNPKQELEAARVLFASEPAIRKLMGRPYWDVVGVCLNWRNVTGLSEDLAVTETQRVFYDEVVHKLKSWVEFF